MGVAQTTTERLEQALDAYEQNRWQEARGQFTAVGAPAIPFMADVIQARRFDGARQEVFWGMLHSIEGPGTDEAWIALLYRDDPRIRAEAAAELGARKTRQAVPCLIALLDDRDPSGIVVNTSHGGSTGEATSTPILVREYAQKALEEITGTVLGRKLTTDGRVEAWKAWWRTHAHEYSTCTGPN
jgi:hypothetical protein